MRDWFAWKIIRADGFLALSGSLRKTVIDRSIDMKQKYLQDASLLEQALKEEPENGINVFYLAMSYDLVSDWESALKNYERCVCLRGDELQIFASMYRIGFMQERLGFPFHQVVHSYLEAFQFRTTRPEPIFCLVNYFMKIDGCFLGYLLLKFALFVPRINDYFSSRSSLYDYELFSQFAECAYKTGRYDESYVALTQVLQSKNLPPDFRRTITQSLPALHALASNE